MARKGHTKVVYKGTFVCKQTLPKGLTPEQIAGQIWSQTDRLGQISPAVDGH